MMSHKLRPHQSPTQLENIMANYHQTGFHTLQELAKTKKKTQENTDINPDFKVSYPCEDKKADELYMKRWVETMSDCD